MLPWRSNFSLKLNMTHFLLALESSSVILNRGEFAFHPSFLSDLTFYFIWLGRCLFLLTTSWIMLESTSQGMLQPKKEPNWQTFPTLFIIFREIYSTDNLPGLSFSMMWMPRWEINAFLWGCFWSQWKEMFHFPQPPFFPLSKMEKNASKAWVIETISTGMRHSIFVHLHNPLLKGMFEPRQMKCVGLHNNCSLHHCDGLVSFLSPGKGFHFQNSCSVHSVNGSSRQPSDELASAISESEFLCLGTERTPDHQNGDDKQWSCMPMFSIGLCLKGFALAPTSIWD